MKKPGAPLGNKNAVKEKVITEALRRVVIQNPDKLKIACLKMLEKAEEGDIAAFREITDRLDGKAVQAIEGTGEGGQFTVIFTPSDAKVL